MTQTAPPTYRSSHRDDLAYIAPMAAFLLLTQVGSSWPASMPVGYVIKTFLAGALLIWFRKSYTRIRWDYWWLGVLVGIVGIVQWVGMELLLLKYFPHYPRLAAEAYDPVKMLGHNPAWMWSFILIRWAGAALMVPFMEELFWRDFLWRTTQAPNDFKLAGIGEPDWKAVLIVAALFASVHIQWITALVWGLMIAVLLIRTRSLGACIIAHGVTNLLLGAYVQYTHDWYFW
jgi:hypothetical protein